MDFVSFLGGLALGAAGAALIDNARSGQGLLGQGVVSGPSGGGPSGGPGVMVGPPGGGGGGSYIPSGGSYVNTGGGLGPGFSVPPIIHNGGGVVVDGDGDLVTGDSFFGISASPWFWPLNFPIFTLPLFQPPQTVVCKKFNDEDGVETVVCERKYPVRTVTWGPPSGWL